MQPMCEAGLHCCCVRHACVQLWKAEIDLHFLLSCCRVGGFVIVLRSMCWDLSTLLIKVAGPVRLNSAGLQLLSAQHRASEGREITKPNLRNSCVFSVEQDYGRGDLVSGHPRRF